MNSLKPVFTIAALGLVSAVVYVAISRPSKDGPPPPEAAAYSNGATEGGAPAVQIGAPGSGGPYGGTGASGPGGQMGYAIGPGQQSGAGNSYGGVAPSFSPQSGDGEMAPPYNAGGLSAAASAPPYGSSQAGGGEDDFQGPSGRQFRGETSERAGPGEAPAWDNHRSAADPPDTGQQATRPRDPETTAPIGGDAPPFSASSSQADDRYASAGSASEHLDHEHTGPQSSASGEGDIGAMFDSFMAEVDRELEAGRLAEAHAVLSRFYRRSGLSDEQSRKVTDLLDQLAGTVIYSREHRLERPYMVRPGETLEDIAQRYEVPWQLLANINGIDDPHRVRPGDELKVVRGPFRALVHLEDRELTLMLGERYAGRFPIGVGHDVPPDHIEGTYQVGQKTVGPTYQGPDGLTFRERDPRNPLGGWALYLDRPSGQPTAVALHGTNDARNVGRSCDRGTICLDDRDIQDLYAILSVGSRVEVTR